MSPVSEAGLEFQASLFSAYWAGFGFEASLLSLLDPTPVVTTAQSTKVPSSQIPADYVFCQYGATSVHFISCGHDFIEDKLELQWFL